MKSILVLAVIQVGALGAIATLLAGCTEPNPQEPTGAPTISNLTAAPNSIPVGGTATITGTITYNGGSYTWSAAFSADSSARGTLVTATGTGANIRVTFNATAPGDAFILVTVDAGGGGSASERVRIAVRAGGDSPTNLAAAQR